LVEAKGVLERVHPVEEAGRNSVMLNTKAISHQEAGGRMTATKQDNRLLTTTATGEAMVAEIEMVATTEHVSSATKKVICLVNALILTQGHPENQWSVSSAIKRGTCPKTARIIRVTVTVAAAERVSSATKKAICLVNARTNKAMTGVLNVNAEMTEVLTGEMRAGSTTTRQNLQTLDGRTASQTRLRSKIMPAGGTPKQTTAVAGEKVYMSLCKLTF